MSIVSLFWANIHGSSILFYFAFLFIFFVLNAIPDFKIGKAIKIVDGEKVAIFTTGAIAEEVVAAREILKKSGLTPALYTFPTVKPIDKDVIKECSEKFDFEQSRLWNAERIFEMDFQKRKFGLVCFF